MSNTQITTTTKRKRRQPKLLSTAYEKSLLYDVRTALEYLLNEGKSVGLRALKLYEFLAAIHFTLPSKGKRSIDEFGGGFQVPVYKTPYNRARLMAAMQLMEHFAKPDPKRARDRKRPLSVRAFNVPFMEIYDEFGRFGGWHRACRIGRPELLKRRFEKEQTKLKVAGAVIEFSLHATPEQVRKAEDRGITTAFRVLGVEGNLHLIAGYWAAEGFLEDRWREARRVAIFGHILYYGNVILYFDVTEPEFAVRLLSCTETTDTAKKIVVTFNEVQRRLSLEGYVFPTLELALSDPIPTFNISPSAGMSKIPSRREWPKSDRR